MSEEKARWRGRQFHNQPELSHQHRFAVEMWQAIGRETSGRIAVRELRAWTPERKRGS